MEASDPAPAIEYYRTLYTAFAANFERGEVDWREKLYQDKVRQHSRELGQALDEMLYTRAEERAPAAEIDKRMHNYRRTVCQMWHVTAAEMDTHLRVISRDFWSKLVQLAAKAPLDTAVKAIKEEAAKRLGGAPIVPLVPGDVARAAVTLGITLEAVQIPTKKTAWLKGRSISSGPDSSEQPSGSGSGSNQVSSIYPLTLPRDFPLSVLVNPHR